MKEAGIGWDRLRGMSQPSARLTGLVASAVFVWVLAHLLPAPLALIAGCGYLLLGFVVGWMRPAAGLLLALALVPYLGLRDAPAVGELMRVVPIWGAALRLLLERAADGSEVVGNRPPRALLTLAALMTVLLYLLSRFTTSFVFGRAPAADAIAYDLLFILGGSAALYTTWIVVSHLVRAELERVLRWFPVIMVSALVVAIAAWAGLPLVGLFTFEPEKFGRLAGLGYPTPPAMGVAIGLPLAVGALWPRTRGGALAIAALGVATIVLTQSRGPLIALIVAGLIAVLLQRRVSWRWIFAGGLAAAAGSALLLTVRYGTDVLRIFSGALPDLKGDALRIKSWFAAWDIALSSPLLGGGFLSVKFWREGKLDDMGLGFSHNIVLQGLGDGGFPLALAILMVISGSVAALWRNRRGINPAWAAAAVALLVCGLWDMPQVRAYAAVAGGLALGLVARPDAGEPASERLANE